MKKTLLFAGIAAAALLASCTKELAPVETSFDPGSIIVNLKVSALGGDTKAVKAGWAAGDVIDIWYDNNTQKAPDLVVKYDGSAWAADGSATLSGNAPAASGTLNAVYFAAANQSDYTWDGASANAPKQDGKVVSDLVAYSQKMAYTYAGSTLSAALGSWKFLANTQIVMTGTGLNAADWALKCDNLKAASGFAFADGGIAEGTSTLGDFVLGQTNADGIAFYFVADSDASKDYAFTLLDLKTGDKFAYKAAGKTLATSNATRNAAKVAKAKFGIDYYQNFLDGKDLVIDSKTVNSTNYPSYTLVSSNITVAELQTLLNSYGLIFIENGVTIDQNGGTTTLILKKETALVGRMDNGVQPVLSLGAYNFNTVYDLILKNICLLSKVATGPIQNASMTVPRSVYVEDCTVSTSCYVILDRAVGADYETLYFNNNILAFSSVSTAMFMYTYASKTTAGADCKDYRFTNNVFYFNGEETKGNQILLRFNAKGKDSNFYAMENLVMTLKNNTLYNICSSYLINVGSCKQINFDNNVWDSALGSGSSANLFTLNYAAAAVKPSPSTSTVKDNYVYANNYDGGTYNKYFGTPAGTYFTVTNWNNTRKGQAGAGSLLGEIDADTFYFPVNPSKVGTAGASYDTKKWVLRDWTK